MNNEGSERMQGMWEEEAHSDPDLPPANIMEPLPPGCCLRNFTAKEGDTNRS